MSRERERERERERGRGRDREGWREGEMRFIYMQIERKIGGLVDNIDKIEGMRARVR